MAPARPAYRPRDPERGVPRFVEQEFHQFLTCGILAHGFARPIVPSCFGIIVLDRLLPRPRRAVPLAGRAGLTGGRDGISSFPYYSGYPRVSSS